MAQVVDGVETHYTLDVAASLEQVLVEETGGVATTYLYGLGRIAYRTGAAEWRYYLADGLGNVRAEVSAAGVLLTVRRFSPFGEPLQGGDGGTPFGYTGEQWDASAGLLYLRARYYSPALGRFISKDPFPGFVELPGSLNPYSYAFNDPVNLTDPSGHFAPLLIPLILGGVIGGGFAAVAYMQTHPCADFWSDRDFQRAVGVGILSGVAGGAAGLGAGIALGFFIPSSTLVGAIVVGTFAGAVGGGATQVTANALTGQSLTEGLTRAVLVGAAAGGVGGAVGYGIGRALQPPPKVVYRAGPATSDNLTPRPRDTEGLSTYDTPEMAFEKSPNAKKAQVIETSKLKPPLQAIPDKPPAPPGHVSITPGDPALIEQWMATRGTGETHPFTEIVMGAIIDEIRRPK